MDSIINFGIPHIGEQIFSCLGEDDLIQCREVSQTWKILSEKALLKTWKGKMFKACETGKTEIVKLLLENYNTEESGLNVKSEYGETSFMMACKNGHKDVVKLLIDYSKVTIDLNERSNSGWTSGWTALMYACSGGHKSVVKILLDCSNGTVDLNARTDKGSTAFMWACGYGHKNIVKMLLDYSKGNIDYNARNDFRSTGFIHACSNGRKDVVKLLLEQSAEYIDFNASDKTERSGFVIACKLGHIDVVKLILEYAKEKDIKIPKSNTIFYNYGFYWDQGIADPETKEIKFLLDEYHSSVIGEHLDKMG